MQFLLPFNNIMYMSYLLLHAGFSGKDKHMTI